MISPITGHSVRNMKHFFANYDIVVKNVSFFSQSSAVLCLFQHLQYAANRHMECVCIIEKPIPLVGLTEASVRLLRLGFLIPPRAWMSVCCVRCVLFGRGLNAWSPVRRSSAKFSVSEWYLEAPWKERPWPQYGLKHLRKKKKEM